MKNKKIPWLVRGDIDGFFGLFTDNLLQLMMIMVLCTTVCGFDSKLLNAQVMTGAAVSLIFGNLFYGWQARRLAIKTGNPAMTALPYGINTTTIVAFIFFHYNTIVMNNQQKAIIIFVRINQQMWFNL